MAKGRPRKAGVKRTKSGAISRAAGANNENAEAIALRMRVFGLTEKEARDQKASTYVGRLCLAGIRHSTDGVSEAQYDAAMAYQQAYTNFKRAVKSPDALAVGSGGASGAEGPGYEQWCQRAVSKWEGIKQAVYAEQELYTHANMWAALDYIVSQDTDLPHMIGDLRLGLNAVAHHLGIIAPAGSKAAPKARAA